MKHTRQAVALEKAKVRVDRVVPAVWPDEPASAYFHQLDGDPDGGESSDTVITWSSAEGVATWPADGSLARALLPDPAPDDARWFATPAVAAPAERWLGRPVIVQTPAEHMLQAARSLWNLLQFELTPRSKGLHALRDQWRRLMSPQWRPVRAGLAALVAVQVLGLNLWAWHEKRDVQRQRSEMVQLLRQAHPQVQVVLDAPVQMQKETELLRAAAGEPGDNDLESLMGAVAAAWPAEQASPSLQYDGNSLTLGAPAGWGAPEIEALRERLLAAGVELEVDPAGLIAFATGAAKSIADRDVDALIGANFLDIIQDADRGLAKLMLTTLNQRGRLSPPHPPRHGGELAAGQGGHRRQPHP